MVFCPIKFESMNTGQSACWKHSSTLNVVSFSNSEQVISATRLQPCHIFSARLVFRDNLIWFPGSPGSGQSLRMRYKNTWGALSIPLGYLNYISVLHKGISWSFFFPFNQINQFFSFTRPNWLNSWHLHHSPATKTVPWEKCARSMQTLPWMWFSEEVY